MNKKEKENLKKEIIRDMEIRKQNKIADILDKIALFIFLTMISGVICVVPVTILLNFDYDFLAGIIVGVAVMSIIVIYKREIEE